MTIGSWSNVDGVRTCVRTRAGTSAVGGGEGNDENGGNARVTTRAGGRAIINETASTVCEQRPKPDRPKKERKTNVDR